MQSQRFESVVNNSFSSSFALPQRNYLVLFEYIKENKIKLKALIIVGCNATTVSIGERGVVRSIEENE